MAPEAGRVVLHVDMDAFYAAVEERERPELRGRPVVVGADPQEGRGRGVVTTANYAARAFGVRSAMPIARAYRLCPHAVYLRPDFPLYEAVSEEVMAIVRRHGDRCEVVGIDEAYLDVTRRAGSFAAAARLATALQGEVRDRLRLTCSVGVAPNKLVAKIASDHRKPDGLTVVRPDEVADFLAPKPVRTIPGIGPKTEALLARRGVTTIADLRRLTQEDLVEAFGTFGVQVYRSARGEDDEAVAEGPGEPVSLGTERTFPEDLEDRAAVRAAVDELVRELHGELLRRGLRYRTVTLKVRYEDFETITRSRTLRGATDDLDALRRIADRLQGAPLDDPRRVRLVGVRVSHLVGGRARQADLRRWG